MKLNYTVIDNFISDEEADSLIAVANENVDWNRLLTIHGGRAFCPNASPEFLKMVENSPAWRSLQEKLNCQEFLAFCADKLQLESREKMEYYPFFSRERKGFWKKLQRLSTTKASQIGTRNLVVYMLVRLFLKPFLFFRFRLPEMMGGQSKVDLLFDLSRGGNGYTREIHSDSDARIIVFLIYLNELEEGCEGGGLEMLRMKEDRGNATPAQPDRELCEVVEEVDPQKGRLVIFENNVLALHAVSEIKKLKGFRYFCYGGFTSLTGLNPSLRNAEIKLPTEFQLYI